MNQPTNPSPETHIYIGNFRPTIQDAMRNTRTCPLCRRHFSWDSSQSDAMTAKQCLDAGHFDTPVYKSIEDVLRIRKEQET